MNATREEWRPIPGYEGYYEVSNLGRVQSLDRDTRDADGRPRRLRGRVLAPNLVGKGYHAVSLYRDQQLRRAYFHRLVMESFVGPAPAGMEVCHIDGDPLNNNLSNLRYDTASGNNMDKARHGTLVKGEQAAGARLTAEQVREIRERFMQGATARSLAEEFGTTANNMYLIRDRTNWAWLD